MKTLLTHKGWFGLCPIYMQDPDQFEVPFVVPRHRAFEWLFALSEALYGLSASAMAMVSRDWEHPGWPIIVTGKRASLIEVGDE